MPKTPLKCLYASGILFAEAAKTSGKDNDVSAVGYSPADFSIASRRARFATTLLRAAVKKIL